MMLVLVDRCECVCRNSGIEPRSVIPHTNSSRSDSRSRYMDTSIISRMPLCLCASMPLQRRSEDVLIDGYSAAVMRF